MHFLLALPLLPTYPNEVIKTVLFICTGNFYRSRFAEAIFNATTEKNRVPWKAISRGLAIHWAQGYLSPYTEEALKERNIELRHTGTDRIQLLENDLRNTDLQIALDHSEHYSMMQDQFPQWADRITYWDIADMPFSSPAIALPAIEAKIQSLIQNISS
jgi:protein-tyrosine phosphatase